MYSALKILALTMSLTPAAFASPLTTNDTSLDPRQNTIYHGDPTADCCQTHCKVKLADNPHVQYPWHNTQVTDYTECEADVPGCSASYSSTFTEGFSVSSGLNVGFFSAGIDVSESWSKTDGHACPGKAGSTVCVWMRVKYATYDVTADGTPICKHDGSATMSSPLDHNPGGGFYCVEGDACKSKGDDYWCTPDKGKQTC